MTHVEKHLATECRRSEHIRCTDDDCECRCHSNASAGIVPQRIVTRY